MGIDIRVESHVDAVIDKIDAMVEQRMLEAMNHVRSATIEILSGTRSGRIYNVLGTHRQYTASSPGEPPAVQMGDLRKSVKGGVEKEGKSVIGYVGTDLEKGPMLEFGTRNMSARPWLRPSFEKSSDTIKGIFSKVWFR